MRKIDSLHIFKYIVSSLPVSTHQSANSFYRAQGSRPTRTNEFESTQWGSNFEHSHRLVKAALCEYQPFQTYRVTLIQDRPSECTTSLNSHCIYSDGFVRAGSLLVSIKFPSGGIPAEYPSLCAVASILTSSHLQASPDQFTIAPHQKQKEATHRDSLLFVAFIVAVLRCYAQFVGQSSPIIVQEDGLTPYTSYVVPCFSLRLDYMRAPGLVPIVFVIHLEDL